MNNNEKLINFNNYDFSKYLFCSGTKTISLKYNYVQIMALKKYIEIIYKCKTSWTYKKDSILYFSFILDRQIELDEKIIKFNTNIVFNSNRFSKLSITSYLKESTDDDNIKRSIRNYNKNLTKNLKDLCKKIEESTTKDNYFFEPVQLCYGSIYGYFDFGRLIIDAGKKVKAYHKPEIIKLKIKYSKIFVNDMPIGTPVCDTLLIDRDIIKKLLQLILRFPFEKRISDGIYYVRDEFITSHNFELDEANIGKTYSVNRDEIINNDLYGFPDDTKKIIDRFYLLDYEKKNAFIKSCSCYINGLNSESTKAIAYYVLAIENLANFNSKPSQVLPKQGNFYEMMTGNKTKKIYREINNVFGKEIVSYDYINILYKARSSHFHDGLENNDILENALEIDEHNKTLIDSAERLVHSFLIKWLIVINGD